VLTDTSWAVVPWNNSSDVMVVKKISIDNATPTSGPVAKVENTSDSSSDTPVPKDAFYQFLWLPSGGNHVMTAAYHPQNADDSYKDEIHHTVVA